MHINLQKCKMAAYYNSKRSDNKKTILKEKYDKKYSNIEYEKMNSKLHRFDNYEEKITYYGDLADLLSYAKQFTGDDALTTIVIDQPDEPSSDGPVD